MENISAIERQIVGAVLEDAEAAGYLVSVYDGEEWVVSHTDNYTFARSAVGATGYTTLRFRAGKVDHTGKFPSVGSVFFVHGNDAECLADCSDNPAILALVRRAEALAECAL